MKRTLSLLLTIAMALSLCACGPQAEDLSDVPTWQGLYDLGSRYLSKKSYEEAILAFTAAIEIDSGQAEAYGKLADAYFASGDIQTARHVLQKGYIATDDDALLEHSAFFISFTPSPTPAPTPEPITGPTVDPTAEPSANPTPTPTPDPTPDPTPNSTPKPTSKPKSTPKPTSKPKSTPKPTATATPTPTPTATVTESPQSDFTIENGVLVKYLGSSGNVVIPSNVTSIGVQAFLNCPNVTSISIPSSVTNISGSAFNYCSDLKNIFVDKGNRSYISVNGVLFSKSKEDLIKYPAGKTSASYTVPRGVIRIGQGAFQNCTNLTSVSIPSGVIDIKHEAFSDCSNLVIVSIPSTVVGIGAFAFSRCSSLSNVSLPNGVTAIGDSAFSNCSGLVSVTIPTSVTKIGQGAFSYCKKLANVYYAGTSEQWSAITLGSSNDSLSSAILHYQDKK